MAGIGFELKKIFKKNSIIAKFRGSTYACITTIGPLILVFVTLLLIYAFLGYNNILFATKDLLSSAILYIFIFSLCTTAPFNSVLSRYVADKIFENHEEDILPSYYAALTANIAFSALIGISFSVWAVFVGKISVIFMFICYCAYIGLVIVFFSMLYLTALKEYLKISLAFFLGMLTTLILGVLFNKVFGIGVDYSIITAFAIGFLVTAVIQFSLVKGYFKENSKKYRDVFSYFKLHWKLLLTNTFYVFGLYIHNFVFWTTDLKIVVERTFVSAPTYDMATFIAMLLNISTTVIFIVQVETNFHDRYQDYCQTVMGGTGEDIKYAKHKMFEAIYKDLFFIFELQAIITIILYLIALVVLPSIGVGGIILHITASLAVAYLLIFMMYNLIIYIYYFNIYNKALMTSAIFFVVTFVGTLISKELNPSLYGLGVLAGAFAGFAYAYFSLSDIEKNLDYYIFCSGTIAQQVVDEEWGHTIFENDNI